MNANLEKLKKTLDHGTGNIVFSIARVPNTTRAFYGTSDFKLYEVNLGEPKLQPKEFGTHGAYVTGVALAADNKVLVSGGYDGRLIWWDVEKKAEIRALDAHKKWIRGVFPSPDGKTIASVADDMVCRLWSAETGGLQKEFRGHAEITPHHFQSMLYCCGWSADGKLLATADKTAKIVVWEVATGKQLATLEAPILYTWDPVQRIHSIGGVRSVAFSADGTLLAVGGTGKIGNIDHLEAKARVEVFDWKKGERVAEIVSTKSQGIVNHLEFHPKGDWLLGAGGAGDGWLLFMDVKEKKFLREEKVPMHVHDLVVNEARDTIYTVGHHRIAIFEMKA